MNTIARACFILGFSFMLTAAASGRDVRYPVSMIPPSLLPADAVVRIDSLHFVIKDEKRSTYSLTYAVTIFSKKEQHRGVLSLAYGRYQTISDLEGTIFDADGNEIRDLEEEDIQDGSGDSGGSLADEWRIRRATLLYDRFPYTVEYRYTMKLNTSLNWPGWSAQTSKAPVERTSFTIIAPKDVAVRTWCNTSDCIPAVQDDGSTIIRTWSRQHLPGLSDDEAAESSYDITTMVKAAPSRFQLEETEGSMESWKEFGAWFQRLYDNRQSLPEDALREIGALVQSAQTEREKIRMLYEYMQSRTRYVSVQLGIGGWQPFEASSVHTKRYGDCKALVNYMMALLHAAGIRSYPVLINSGSNRISMITEFPSNQFDHVILCVPQERDSIWLECTSQSAPFGRLGDFTENRPALLVSETGGTVVHTPATSAGENLQMRTVTASLAATGTITAEITARVAGDQQMDLQGELLHESPEEKQEYFLNRLKTPNISISSFSIEGLENRAPEITVRFSATLGRYAALNSARLFVPPSLMERATYVPADNKARKSPVRFSYPYVDIDSIYLRLPRNFVIETLPKETSLRTSFGSFSGRTVALGDTAIAYTRRTEITGYMIPAAAFQEYRSFRQEIAKADKAQAVLRMKQ
ncbi:MAG: DUF3857 domain-containing protein [Acidobacteriota bacterium]